MTAPRQSKTDIVKQSVGIGKDSNDISPAYIVLAVLLGAGGLGLFLLHAWRGKDNSWVDVVMFGIVALLVLALIRPKFFDSTIKTIADKLPVFKFTKD